MQLVLCPGRRDCFLTLRGIKTLALRMAQHCRNGLQVAQFLADHPPSARHLSRTGKPSAVRPGASTNGGPGGMVSFTVHGGETQARIIANKTELFTLAESLGGVDRLSSYLRR